MPKQQRDKAAMAAAVETNSDGDVDFSFLPDIQHIVKCMDKDNADVQQELSKLKAKIEEVRTRISTMPGIDMHASEQQQQLCALREQMQSKKQLLQKYKSLPVFELPKAS